MQKNLNGFYLLSGEGLQFPTASQLSNPLVAGVTIRVPLSQVWLGINNYNFTGVISQIQQAQAAGKLVTLDFMGGGYLGTWIAGSVIEDLIMAESRRGGSTTPINDIIPVVYGSNYQQQLMSFIIACGRALAPYSGTVVGICCTGGITAKTEEWRLTVQDFTSPDPNNIIPASQATIQAWNKWKSTGYTQAKVLSASKSVVLAWAAAFPNAKLMLYLITNEAFFDDSGGTNETITDSFLQWINATYGNRVYASYTYLNYNSSFPSYSPVYGEPFINNMNIGMQLAQVLYSGAIVNDQQVSQTFNPAIANGVKRFEIYPDQLIQNAVEMGNIHSQIAAPITD